MLENKMNLIAALSMLTCIGTVSAKNVNVSISVSSTITNDTPYVFTLFNTSSPIPSNAGRYKSAPARILVPNATTTISAVFMNPGVPYPYTYTQYEMTRDNGSPIECNSVHFAPYHDAQGDRYSCWLAGPNGELPVYISRAGENHFVIHSISSSK